MDESTAPATPMPPGGPIDIVFSFDTTGSMAHCLPQVRANLAHVIERLTADIPGLRIAVFAHGDYCDRATYVTKYIDFTNNVVDLCEFVNGAGATTGGDFDECYELVLRQVREELSWQPGTQRALVMIGDATPHGVSYPQNTQRIDWKEEVNLLAGEMGVRVYAVQCMNRPQSDSFYSYLAKTSDGKHLKLDQLTSIVEMMMAVCYCERGAEFVEAYEQEIRDKNVGGMRADLERMFDTLKGHGAGKGSSPAVTKKKKKKKGTPAPIFNRLGTNRLAELFTSSSDSDDDDDDLPKTSKTPCREPPKRRKINTKSITRKSAEKRMRERTARKDFILANLRWSHWNFVMANKAPRGEKEDWEDRLNDRPGVKRTTLFTDKNEPAVYEVAIQPPDCNQKVPVLGSVSQGFHHRSWEAGLLHRPHVKSQIDKVLKRRCKLYIRRARFAKEDLPGVYERSGLDKKTVDAKVSSNKDVVKELRGLMTSSCDYAWRMHYDKESKKYGHRPLVKKGVVISE